MKIIKFLPFYFVSVFPLSFLYLLSNLAFVLVYYVFRYRRDIVKSNLDHSFPTKSQSERLEIEQKFFRHFCDLTVESIKVLSINKKAISKRFRLKNTELIEHLHKQNKNIIMYTAHYGNWEWLAFLPLLVPHQLTTFYQPLKSKYFDDIMKLIRSRFGVICIESNNGYKRLLKLKQENILTLNLIVGDQSPGMHVIKHWTKFLNQETAFLTGADKMAKKMNQAVVFPAFRKPKRGVYEIEFILLEASPEPNKSPGVIDQYAQILEEKINISPELWLWSHNRWKLELENND